jgi:GTP-binding protein YchF
VGFNCGIVGLPNVGKSTLFNAITAAGAEASNYPFCTINPNVGIVTLPDERVDLLARVFKPSKCVYTSIEFVDIAGLVRGASKGEGLGNQFLAHIREVDAIAHVVRCFDDPNVVHVDGSVNPRRDIEVVETELILKDVETVEHRLSEAERRAKTADRKLKAEAEFIARVREHLLAGRLARYLHVNGEEEAHWLRDMHLLTGKPVMYVCNVHEKEIAGESRYAAEVREIAAKEGASVVTVSAEVEAEIAELAPGERKAFLEDMGLAESGLDKVVRAGYALLHLITFFTVNPKELHAWTVRAGTMAAQAAGVVHTDFERGFIRAEIMKSADLARLGSEQSVKDHGLLHVHGREYVMEDGDVMYVRFSA